MSAARLPARSASITPSASVLNETPDVALSVALNAPLEPRAVAAYLGLAIGDALGATVEFMTPREIAAQFKVHDRIIGGGWLNLKPGQVTDDTTMALALGDSILAAGRVDRPEAQPAEAGGEGVDDGPDQKDEEHGQRLHRHPARSRSVSDRGDADHQQGEDQRHDGHAQGAEPQAAKGLDGPRRVRPTRQAVDLGGRSGPETEGQRQKDEEAQGGEQPAAAGRGALHVAPLSMPGDPRRHAEKLKRGLRILRGD